MSEAEPTNPADHHFPESLTPEHLAEPSAERAAGRIEAWYGQLEPRLGKYLTDPNVVLTLADARGQTEFYVDNPQPDDAATLDKLNEHTLNDGVRLSTFASSKTGSLIVNVESLAGYQLVSEHTQLPGIPRFDAADGWDRLKPWYDESLAGIRAAAERGLYPPEILENDLDKHAIIGVCKGYPDIAIMDMVNRKPPMAGKPDSSRFTKIAYADYYKCAQPNYSYDAAHEADIAPHAAAWGKILEDYYTSAQHRKLANDPDFQAAR